MIFVLPPQWSKWRWVRITSVTSSGETPRSARDCSRSILRVIETINIFQLFRPFRSVAVVDKDDLAVADEKEAPCGKRDAVAGIGRICFRPEHPRHNAEHCAAVERKAPGFNRVNFITADVHNSRISTMDTKQKRSALPKNEPTFVTIDSCYFLKCDVAAARSVKARSG